MQAATPTRRATLPSVGSAFLDLRLLAVALLALPLWLAVTTAIGPRGWLQLWLRSDAPLAGMMRWTSFGLDGGTRPLTMRLVTQRSPRVLSVEITPLGRRNPKGAGSEVWLNAISSPCGEAFRRERLHVPHGWLRDARGMAALWPGGVGPTLRYKTRACSPVALLLGHHSFSGAVRIRLIGAEGTPIAERTVDLYQDEKSPARQYRAERLAWHDPHALQEIALGMPAGTRTIELRLESAGAVEVEAAAWTSRRESWAGRRPVPGVRIEPGGQRVRIPVARASPLWPLAPWRLVVGFAGMLGTWGVLEALGGRTRAARAFRRVLVWGRYGVVPAVVWFGYWIAFFPAVAAYDPLVQWAQIVEGRFNDWHPALHTWILELFAYPFGSPAPLALLQVLLGAIVVARLLAALREHDVPAWIVWGLMLWIAGAPVFGFFIVAVQKDTLFGLAVLATALAVWPVVDRRRLTLQRATVLAVLLAAVALLRHNGPAVMLSTLAALTWWCGRTSLRALATAWSLCLVLVGVVRGPIYRWAAVEPPSPILVQHFVLHQVAGLVAAGTPLEPDEAAYLERMAPLATWRSAYACHSSIDLLFKSGLAEQPLHEQPLRLARIWWHLARRNPRALARHMACVTRFVWSPRSEIYIGPITREGDAVDPNPFGFATRPWLPALNSALTRVIVRTARPSSWLRAFVWQPAFSLYVLVVGGLVAAARARSAGPLLVLLPGYVNTAVWLCLPSSPDLRFQWPVVLLAPLAVGLAVQRGTVEPRGAAVTDGEARRGSASCAGIDFSV